MQDSMVFQRAIVWGYGDAHAVTTLTINGTIYTTMSRSELANAQNESIWSVTLDPVSDEGPFDIYVTQSLLMMFSLVMFGFVPVNRMCR